MRTIAQRVVGATVAIVVLIPILAAQKTKGAAPAPVPPQIAAAQKVFVSNAGGESFETVIEQTVFNGGPDRPYNQFYAAMTGWGRYGLVSSPAEADLVFEISWVLSDTGLRLPVLGQLRLVVVDPKTHVTLWNFTEYVRGAILLGNRDKNFDQAMNTIVDRLKKIAETHPVTASTGLQGSSIEAAGAARPGKTAFADTEPGVITTVVGKAGGSGGDGGPAGNAGLSGPFGVFVDASGNLLIAESLGHRIRRVDHATGMITTAAGIGRCYQGICDGFFSGDGGPATAAELNNPKSVIADTDGNLFISDTNNNRIRRVDKTTGMIATVAGTYRGFSGDDGPAKGAELNNPQGIALDASGNLFIADSGNGRVRRVDHATGIITTVAGRGRGVNSGDGQPATSAGLLQPTGLLVDVSGDLLIATYDSIRRVDHATGMISTVAGGNGRGSGGDGGPAIKAQLMLPEGIVADGSGNLFIADFGNHRIRRVDHATGIISTVAGNGEMGYGGGFSGDGGPAASAQLRSPAALAMDAAGNLFVADANNHRIRRIQMASVEPASSSKAVVDAR